MFPTNHLLVFTRYPNPGTTKTRLIPALGATGAAFLQQQMTEHTLQQAALLVRSEVLTASVRYTGSDRPEMEQWLGPDWTYVPQGIGDLGLRLTTAFASGFETATGVIAIGIDCPALTSQRLREACEALETHDVVLGPASDGGYYLIGLKRDAHAQWAELFRGIEWSSDRVLAQTEAQVKSLGLACQKLPPLTDVDYPHDLAQWQAVAQRPLPATTETISIIMPVLDEASRIQAGLSVLQRQLRDAEGVEIIVVDGSSADKTVGLAQASGATVISTEPGRARQMNAGAAIAQGDILLFLHGDTQLPDRFITLIRQTLVGARSSNRAAAPPVAGAFSLKIRGEDRGLRLVEWGVGWRSRYFKLPYGDQALFVRADRFQALGGFPDLPIMEDFEFVRQLRRQGDLAILPEAVTTSGRRWRTVGILQTTVINQLIVLGYLIGIPPQKLCRWYRRSPPAQPQPLQNS